MEAFRSPGQNMVPEALQEAIWKHFKGLVRTCSQRPSRRTFGGISKAWSEYGPRWPPGGHLEAFLMPGLNSALSEPHQSSKH